MELIEQLELVLRCSSGELVSLFAVAHWGLKNQLHIVTCLSILMGGNRKES